MKQLESKRTTLRRLMPTDLEKLIALETDPDIVKFTPSRLPLSIDKIKTRLATWIQSEELYSPLGMWIAETKKEKTFIGWFMLMNTDSTYPELGFMITKKEWGKGYATEVAAELIHYACSDLAYQGLSARADHDNLASIRVLEKLHFKLIEQKKSMDKVLNREVETNIYELIL